MQEVVVFKADNPYKLEMRLRQGWKVIHLVAEHVAKGDGICSVEGQIIAIIEKNE